MGQKWSRVIGDFEVHTAEYSTIGRRKTNEDFTCLKLVAHPKGKREIGGKLTPSLFAVFDGHSGRRCSESISTTLPRKVMTHPSYPEDLEKALVDAYLQTDQEFLQDAQRRKLDDGSTALVTVLTAEKLYVANAGDCRAVFCEGGKAVQLTIDHKPDHPQERERIEGHGGSVSNGRISGNQLSVSRGLGDLKFKSDDFSERFVSARPDITTHSISRESEFLILACDGIWDVLSNEEVVEFIDEKLEPIRKFGPSTDIPRELYMICLSLTTLADQKGSSDNMTCMLIYFSHSERKGK